MMAAITYASFPDPCFLDDEPSSPTIHPLERSSLMDESIVASAPVVDLNIIDISDLVGEDEDCVTGLTNLDSMGYHLAPSTPTKGRTRRATMPESLNHRPHEIQFPGVYSPPQTPGTKIEKVNPFSIARPETPPPSTHRLEIPVSPETPTRPPVNNGGGASLFDDNNQFSQPTTPVLYNLIRNEGPPKFVITSKTAEQPVVKESELSEKIVGYNGDIIRGHPSACLFVASLNSTKSEEHLRQSVTELFSQWGTLLNVKVLKDWANRPFSFVQYTTSQEAGYALQNAQKATLDGRMIRVERARVNRTLYICKEKGKIDEAAVKALLEPFGQVEEIVVPGSWKRASKECRKGCFARFVFRDDAINAYQTLRFSDAYSVEWAQNLDRSSSPLPTGTMHKVPIDYTSIFIGQLDCQTDEMAVRERFGKYGMIIAVQVLMKQNIIGRRPTDAPVSGFAFVKYDGRESATRAVKAENGAVFQGRTIRVQYRELHQKIYPSQPSRNPTSLIPKLAPQPTRPIARPQQSPRYPVQPHNLRKIPNTLGQLSGTGGLSSDAVNGFGGFDPITGIANGVYGNINPQFFAAYNAAMTAANTPNSTSSSTSASPESSTPDHRRVLNPLAPPFMFFHPLQFAAYPPHVAAALQHSLLANSNRQQHSDSGVSPVPVFPTWYPPPPHQPAAHSTSEHTQPFPTMPPPPADFASPIPLGPMVAVQSLFGFPPNGNGENVVSHGPMCWDPIVGMFRSATGNGSGATGVTTSGLFEQLQSIEANVA